MIFAICLALLGLVLIYLEFFLPGWILGIGGGLLLLCSIGVLIYNKTGSFSAIAFVVLLPLLVIYTCYLALKQIKMSGVKNSFFLEEDQEGFQAHTINREFIGKTGLVMTDLKPSGHILVNGQALQALSLSGYINKDCKVIIIDGQGGHFVVIPHEKYEK